MYVIGIDESYTVTGVALLLDGDIIKHKALKFKGCKCKTQKRNALRYSLSSLLKNLVEVKMVAPSDIVIICERIRTFSGGGLRPKYLISTGALVATIVDTAFDYQVPVYSVDTRAWKSKIVGNSKARTIDGKRDSKSETMEYVKNTYNLDVDNDTADAICIALYGFLPASKQNLKKED